MSLEMRDISKNTVVYIDAKKYFLLSNDATHVATMKVHGIRDIATNDQDFERAEGIKVWKP